MNPVISISGPPGSGKSSVARALARHLGCELVFYDDYPGLTSAPLDKIQEWIADDMPFEALFIPEFRERVIDLRRSQPVIIETPLGPLHNKEGLQVNFSMWLDCDHDIALARALSKILEQELWACVNEMEEWALGYLSAYLSFASQAIRRQRETVRPKCMLILNAHAPLTSVIEQALEEVGLLFRR